MATHDYDVVILGATPSGLLAAMAATDFVGRVVVLEPGNHVGGLVTGGLSKGDWSSTVTWWGLTKSFLERALALYTARNGGVVPNYEAIVPGSIVGLTWWDTSPADATSIFEEMLAEHEGITILTGKRMLKVSKTDAVITAITTEDGEVYTGKQFIDASYEGDLAAWSGCSMTYGRESQNIFNEPASGFRPINKEEGGDATIINTPCQDIYGNVVPYAMLPPDPSRYPPGSADDRVQAFNFRLAVTNDPAHRVPWPKPPGYRADDFIGLKNKIAVTGTTSFDGGIASANPIGLTYTNSGFGKRDLNGNGAFSLDLPGWVKRWGIASYAERDLITAWLYYQEAGLLYFAGNDPSCSLALRNSTNTFGLCDDEFQTDYYGVPGWSPMPYVREARRLVGQYMLTWHDTIGTGIVKSDPVSKGMYTFDSHVVTRYPLTVGSFNIEGWPDSLNNPTPFSIPWRSLLPYRAQASNLVVTCAFSTTHLVQLCTRLEKTWMVLGEVAGIAAGLAAFEDIQVVDLPYGEIRTQLDTRAAIVS